MEIQRSTLFENFTDCSQNSFVDYHRICPQRKSSMKMKENNYYKAFQLYDDYTIISFIRTPFVSYRVIHEGARGCLSLSKRKLQ